MKPWHDKQEYCLAQRCWVRSTKQKMIRETRRRSSLMIKVKFQWQKQWRGLCCFCFLQVFEWVIEWLNWSEWNETAFLHNSVNWGEAKMSCHQISPTHSHKQKLSTKCNLTCRPVVKTKYHVNKIWIWLLLIVLLSNVTWLCMSKLIVGRPQNLALFRVLERDPMGLNELERFVWYQIQK